MGDETVGLDFFIFVFWSALIVRGGGGVVGWNRKLYLKSGEIASLYIFIFIYIERETERGGTNIF